MAVLFVSNCHMAVLCAMQSAYPFGGSAGHVEASSVAVVTVALWAILVKLSLRGSLGHVSGSMVVISCLHFIRSGFFWLSVSDH